MDFPEYFPIWNKLTAEQQERIRSVTILQNFPAGTLLHDGGANCLGLLLVRSGQLRAYMLSDEGREVTICRFFEMDLCLFSAACVMSNKHIESSLCVLQSYYIRFLVLCTVTLSHIPQLLQGLQIGQLHRATSECDHSFTLEIAKHSGDHLPGSTQMICNLFVGDLQRIGVFNSTFLQKELGKTFIKAFPHDLFHQPC